MSKPQIVTSIAMKKFLRLGFRQEHGRAEKGKPFGPGRLQIGAKVVASRIADVSFGPHETKVDLDTELALKLRDRLNQFLEREDGHHHDGVPAEEL